MTRLTKEHRAIIVRAMMRKTFFKKRFDAETKRLGTVVQALHRDWMVATHGQPLVDCIVRMDKAHRRVLCEEVESVRYSWHGRKMVNVARNLEAMVGHNVSVEPFEDHAYYLGSLFPRGGLEVRLPKVVFCPRDAKVMYLNEVKDFAKVLAPLDAIATEFNAARAELAQFLHTVTTAAKLKELMPEAVEHLPKTAHPVAVIPNAANALAALARAGFYEKEQAPA